MKLIDEWKTCYRYLSVQANTIGAALAFNYGVFYNQLKDNFPPQYMMILTVAVFALGVLGRLIAQPAKEKP